MARSLIAACALAAVVAFLTTGCGASAKASATDAQTQRIIDLYHIDQIEVKFHRATSHHDIDLMMSLWAPRATFTVGAATYTGKAQIRKFFATRYAAFRRGNHWVSETSSFKTRIRLNGEKATLDFVCHYVDIKTGKVASVVGFDQNLKKINGKWLIARASGSTVKLG
jgi:hypothetical protein